MPQHMDHAASHPQHKAGEQLDSALVQGESEIAV